jgi:hypothetical protein
LHGRVGVVFMNILKRNFLIRTLKLSLYIPLLAGLNLTSCVEQADKFKEESISIDTDDFGNPIPRRQDDKNTTPLKSKTVLMGPTLKILIK